MKRVRLLCDVCGEAIAAECGVTTICGDCHERIEAERARDETETE